MGTISTSLGLAIGTLLLRYPPAQQMADLLFLCLTFCITLAVLSFLRPAE